MRPPKRLFDRFLCRIGMHGLVATPDRVVCAYCNWSRPKKKEKA